MTELNMQSLMQQAENAFQPGKANGIDATVLFHITGNQGGDWVARVKDQKLSIENGSTPNPNIKISANTEDVSKLLSGKLNPMQAYMQGKVKIDGDMGMALRLLNLFKL
mgnify:CR=1 FL=1